MLTHEMTAARKKKGNVFLFFHNGWKDLTDNLPCFVLQSWSQFWPGPDFRTAAGFIEPVQKENLFWQKVWHWLSERGCKGNVLEDKRPSREGLGVLGKVTSFEPLSGVTLWIIHCDHDLVGFQFSELSFTPPHIGPSSFDTPRPHLKVCTKYWWENDRHH